MNTQFIDRDELRKKLTAKRMVGRDEMAARHNQAMDWAIHILDGMPTLSCVTCADGDLEGGLDNEPRVYCGLRSAWWESSACCSSWEARP